MFRNFAGPKLYVEMKVRNQNFWSCSEKNSASIGEDRIEKSLSGEVLEPMQILENKGVLFFFLPKNKRCSFFSPIQQYSLYKNTPEYVSFQK